MEEYVYVPYNKKPEDGGRPYFAIGGVHWSRKGAAEFMGNANQWRTLRRKGWRVVKCRLKILPTTKR